MGSWWSLPVLPIFIYIGQIYPPFSSETQEIFISLCPLNKRDAPTLDKLILENVEAGFNIEPTIKKLFVIYKARL